jgi:biopolymer transport protein ExbD
MAGGDVAEPRKHGKGKKRKKSRRLGIRIDMTPLVDIAFLLLTFFMLTTTMSKPQTMEINLPPEDVPVEIAESNLLTVRVNDQQQIFWNMGIEPPARIEYKALRKFLADKNAGNPKLVTLVKIDRKARYDFMVNLMDELNLADVTRFSLAPLTDADKKIIEKVPA